MKFDYLFIILTFFNHFETKDNFELTNPSEFIISGTSTLHDWTMKCMSAAGEAEVLIQNEKIKDITSLEINLVAENLKSDDKLLDKNAYHTLKTNEYPSILFSLYKLNSIKYISETAHISAKGSLLIAGTKKIILLDVNAYLKGENIFFEGETILKLSDFNINSTTFLLGTLKIGNEIKIKFKVTFHSKI